MLRNGQCIAAIAALIGSGLVGTTANADTVELHFNNENVNVSIVGDFMGFREDAYIIRTNSGELHVPASYVTCEGSDCLFIVNAVERTSN